MEYEPGTCNIGAAEVTRRRRMGLVGLVLAAAMTVTRLVTDAALIRVGLVLGLVLGFEGLIQARLRFCAGFAQQGVYDVSDAGDQREAVEDTAAHRKDLRRALTIHAMAAGATVVSYLLLSRLPLLV